MNLLKSSQTCRGHWRIEFELLSMLVPPVMKQGKCKAEMGRQQDKNKCSGQPKSQMTQTLHFHTQLRQACQASQERGYNNYVFISFCQMAGTDITFGGQLVELSEQMTSSSTLTV